MEEARATIEEIYKTLVSGDVVAFRQALTGYSREEIYEMSVSVQISREVFKNAYPEGKPINFYGLLHAAGRHGQVAIMKCLVEEHGVPVDQLTAERSSALNGACYGGRAAVVQYLVQKGADVNLPAHCRRPPVVQAVNGLLSSVDVATAGRYADIVECLVRHGADTAILFIPEMYIDLNFLFQKVLVTNNFFAIFYCLDKNVSLETVGSAVLREIAEKIQEMISPLFSMLMLKRRPDSIFATLPRPIITAHIGKHLPQNLQNYLKTIRAELEKRASAPVARSGCCSIL